MVDERIARMSSNDVPFDADRMVYGGFEMIVDA